MDTVNTPMDTCGWRKDKGLFDKRRKLHARLSGLHVIRQIIFSWNFATCIYEKKTLVPLPLPCIVPFLYCAQIYGMSNTSNSRREAQRGCEVKTFVPTSQACKILLSNFSLVVATPPHGTTCTRPLNATARPHMLHFPVPQTCR